MGVGLGEGLDPDELEGHREWLNKLARLLLRDATQAEDCVQDVFLAALSRGPQRIPGSAQRAWLRRVLVNRARKMGDRDALRRHHEGRAPVWARVDSAGDQVESRELQAELERALLTLSKHERTAILLRHERGLLPAEIAAHLDVPVKTVNSWLYRAYRKLRRRIDPRRIGFRIWGPWLLRIREDSRLGRALERATTALRSIRRAVRRPSRWALSATGLILVAAGVGAWLLSTMPGSAAGTLAQLDIGGGLDDPAPLAAPPPDAGLARAPAFADELVRAPALASTSPASHGPTWSGVVVDADDVRVPDLRLRFEPLVETDQRFFNDHARGGYEGYQSLAAPVAGDSEREASIVEFYSRQDGTFELPSPRHSGWIDVADDAWTLVTTSVALELPPIGAARVRVAPARRVVGRVFDRDGNALASVDVSLRLPDRLTGQLSPFPSGLAYEPRVLTDDRGVFAFACLPDLPDALLGFEKAGFDSVASRLDDLLARPGELEVVLDEEAPGLALAGRTLDSHGAAVAGVVLSFDLLHTTTSDEQGRFRMKLPEALASGRPVTVHAAAPGFQSLQSSVVPAGEGTAELELVFETPALAFTGVVLRADGSPCAGASIWLPAPTPLAYGGPGEPPVFMEHVIGGAQDGGSIEATTADANGRFCLRGLLDRAYFLHVADPVTGEWFASGPLDAGDNDVLLEFPTNGLTPEVRGLVVDRDGAPVPEAFVARSYPRLDVRMPDGRRYRSYHAGEKAAVDGQGGFVLTNVPRSGAVLTVLGPTLETRHVELDDQRNIEQLEIVVGRPCRVVVERGDVSFERFSFAAEPGERFLFFSVSRGVFTQVPEAPMEGERSPEFLVNDLARELVLWSGTREIARVPIALAPETLNVLRP